MAEARTQTSRRWLWIGAVVVLIAVFFTARYFLRERLPVRVAPVEHAMLLNTVSTNGRVEPVANYQFYSPLATTVKAVYAQEGDTVPAGKLLVTLDDVAARAQVASAESAVKAAQATLDAITHNGTQAERQASAARDEQDRLARDQAQHDLDALTKLVAAGPPHPAKSWRRVSAWNRTDQLECRRTECATSLFAGEIARAQAALADAQAALAAAQHIEAQTAYSRPHRGNHLHHGRRAFGIRRGRQTAAADGRPAP